MCVVSVHVFYNFRIEMLMGDLAGWFSITPEEMAPLGRTSADKFFLTFEPWRLPASHCNTVAPGLMCTSHLAEVRWLAGLFCLARIRNKEVPGSSEVLEDI